MFPSIKKIPIEKGSELFLQLCACLPIVYIIVSHIPGPHQ